MTSWHVPSDQIAAYLGGAVDGATAASIEAHVIECAGCRRAVAERSDARAMARSWTAIERAIDREPTSRLELVATRIGVSDRAMRTLAPTLPLQLAWLLATFVALFCAAGLAHRLPGPEGMLARTAFLTIAPLAPLAAVVAALGGASEPVPEIAATTPASRLRIGAVRTATVMLAAIGLGLVASLLLPGEWAIAAAWLIPAFALSGLGALLAGRAAPTTVIGWLGAGWVVTVVVAGRLTHDRLAAFRPGAQAAYLVIAIACAAIIGFRHDVLELRRLR